MMTAVHLSTAARAEFEASTVEDPFPVPIADEDIPTYVAGILGYDMDVIIQGARGGDGADSQLREALMAILGLDLDAITLPPLLRQALADVDEGRTTFFPSSTAMFRELDQPDP